MNKTLAISVLAATFLIPMATTTLAAEAKSSTATVAATAPAAAPARRKLSAEQVALRDRVRQVLSAQRQQPFSMQQNTVTDLLHFCTAFGCDSEILQDATGKKINAITCLCWNYSCAGYEPLMMCNGHVAARIGYGTQAVPGQLLAVLALAGVESKYPLRVGDKVGKVADLVEQEKRSCREGADLSARLLGLSFYVTEPTWKNELGEQWSLEKIVVEETSRPWTAPPHGGSLRLLALSFALEQRATRKQPIDANYQRAVKMLHDCENYAFANQSADGSWSPAIFPGTAGRDEAATLFASGHMLQWLVQRMPEKRLGDPAIVHAVEYVTGMLASPRYSSNVPALETRTIEAVAHATRALALYDARVYQGAEDEKPAPAKTARN
jgi:hypothetical protein